MLRKAQILTKSLTENVFFKYCIFEIKMQYHRRERPLLKGSHNSIKLFRLFEQPEHIYSIFTIKRSFIIRPVENLWLIAGVLPVHQWEEEQEVKNWQYPRYHTNSFSSRVQPNHNISHTNLTYVGSWKENKSVYT